MRAPSSNGSPPMSTPGSPNSFFARQRAATTRCWRQTRRLIEEVLPLAAMRWPKPAKRRGAAWPPATSHRLIYPADRSRCIGPAVYVPIV